MNIGQAIGRLYHLNVGTTSHDGDDQPHERPHKPLLLLAALDLIDAGLATPDRIPWSQALRERFSARFQIVRRHNDQDNPQLPFRHLAGDGFWMPLEPDGKTQLRRDPLVGDIDQVFARLTDGFDVLVAIPDMRRRMREALVARYFPWAAAELLDLPPADAPAESERVAEEDEEEYGRSPAFRRVILEIYDHQCAACGLRIRLSSGNDVSFVDAAHIIPFHESHNDHPTNGLALCKNHHWAMDRNLIAPCPDRKWLVSASLDARRSNGEKELIELKGKSILPPKDPAFHPSKEALEWRCGRLAG